VQFPSFDSLSILATSPLRPTALRRLKSPEASENAATRGFLDNSIDGTKIDMVWHGHRTHIWNELKKVQRFRIIRETFGEEMEDETEKQVPTKVSS